MKLYQRENMWWFGAYVNRKRFQESTGVKIGGDKQQQAAERAAYERIKQIEKGVIKSKKLKFSELGEEYLRLAKKAGSSLLRDRQILVHLNEAFGDLQLDRINRHQIESYRTVRLESVTPATVTVKWRL